MGSKWSHAITTLTPTATADATNLADTTYVGVVQGGSATQKINTLEVQVMGQAASTSSPTFMQLGRDSTVGVTASLGAGETNAALDAATAALAAPQIVGNTFTTKPQRSATLGHLLNLSINAYGGAVRWLAAPGEEISTVGNTASLGELSLSAFTGGTPGALGAHWIYETI